MNLLERGSVELQSGKAIPMQWVKPSYLLIAILHRISNHNSMEVGTSWRGN